MLYIQRNAEGKLARVEDDEFDGMTGTLPADHPDILAWQATESSLLHLKQSDLDMIRVLDDLISVLIAKGVIRITDLPPAARSKLLNRTQAREALGGLTRLINDDEETGLI